MYHLKLILIYQLLLLTVLFSGTVKIGISKPLTTTITPISAATEATTTEANTQVIVSTTGSSTVLMDTTEATQTEGEWADFPPKKSSKATSTEKTTITTIKPSTITISSSVISNSTQVTDKPGAPEISLPNRPIKERYCFCDLTEYTCDIDCCCDHDCSATALKVFRCLLTNSSHFDLYEDRFKDFRYQHGLPSCDLHDGWLCVFKAYKPQAKAEPAYYFKDTTRYYRWPNLLLESEDVKSHGFYKSGDSLRIINMETKDIRNFDLPTSFESSFCHIQEPVYHLKTLQRSCLLSSYENLKKIQLDILQLGEKYKIFITPVLPDDFYDHNGLEDFVGNIMIYKCYENERNCTQDIASRENNEDTEHPTLLKLRVIILHNFTNIHEIVISFWLQNFKEEQHLSPIAEEYWLSYEIEFLNKTVREFHNKNIEDKLKAPIVSGPLGYIIGKPLIIARYEAFNKSQPLSSKNQILNYFAFNKTGLHTLVLLGKAKGVCKTWTNDRELIRYGINVAKYCRIKMENNSLMEEAPAKINFTVICLNLQQSIQNQLFGPDLPLEDLSSYYISQLGRPQNISNKWLELHVYNADFDSIVGQYIPETKTFICRNILLSLMYEFHMATFVVDNMPLQNVINHAALHLAERHDLEFSLNENLEVPVTMTVRFFNAHEAVSLGLNLKSYNLIIFIALELINVVY